MPRILAVDPGEKRIGIALSDPTGMIANPLTVIEHVSRSIDAAAVAALAQENQVDRIIIGQNIDEDGNPTPSGKSAARLAEALRTQTNLPVILWDETGSTAAARQAHIEMGGSRRSRQRRGHSHLDELAATYILQTYLDAGAATEKGDTLP
ncbi:MAG: Holliday junction resolvase RuvX [Anaerolineales bacterium]|jgi:putative Holliday junction resolvase|nr:Holliday junction resolvase RuvX [Anaerolineales bacterium]